MTAAPMDQAVAQSVAMPYSIDYQRRAMELKTPGGYRVFVSVPQLDEYIAAFINCRAELTQMMVRK